MKVILNNYLEINIAKVGYALVKTRPSKSQIKIYID